MDRLCIFSIFESKNPKKKISKNFFWNFFKNFFRRQFWFSILKASFKDFEFVFGAKLIYFFWRKHIWRNFCRAKQHWWFSQKLAQKRWKSRFSLFEVRWTHTQARVTHFFPESNSLNIKKRHPNPALLGGKTFPNKKGLVRRMTMIQSALDRYDPGEYFTYP